MLLMPAGRRRKPIAPSLSMDTRVVEIRSTGIALSYDITEIHARSGERLAIRYINAGDMIHNIVIVKDESDIIPVGVAAMAAHGDEFIPRDKRDRIVAYSRLAGPGKRLRWSSPYRHRESIPYICTYSGHFTMKQGRLIVRE